MPRSPQPRRTDGTVLVVGQIGRDLALALDRVPDAETSSTVRERREMLGGKGANQAVGLSQLGVPVSLLGVVGEDLTGERLLTAAADDGIDTAAVRRRGITALLVDLIDVEGQRRLLEDVPSAAGLTVADVRAARGRIEAAEVVCLQLQQPAEALTEAGRIASAAGARIVLDGAADSDPLRALVARAWLVRADAHEVRLTTGITPDDEESGRAAARRLLDQGAEMVALGIAGGDLVAWPGGHRFFPFRTRRVVDVTGGGDAFLAGMVTGLRSGVGPAQAGELAADCSASTVQRLGGRPDLSALGPGSSA